MRTARILTCLMGLAVIGSLLYRPAVSRGGESCDLALVAAAAEAEAAAAKSAQPSAISSQPMPRNLAKLVSTDVCGPDGCPPGKTCVDGTCVDGACAPGCERPQGGDCVCETCPAQAADCSPQPAGAHRPVGVFRSSGPLMDRGPVRRACRGVVRGVWRFIRDGGPIRQRLRARRGG